MAENITLNSVSTFTNDTSAVNIVNGNNTTITNAFVDCLSRSGVSPNTMGSNLDMNGNQIINLPSPATINSPARLIDVASNPTITVPPTGTSGAVVGFLNGNNTVSGNNTYSGTNTFNNTATFTSTVNLPTASVTGTEIANTTITNANIAANTVGNNQLAVMATNTIKGNNNSITNQPSDLTLTQLYTMITSNRVTVQLLNAPGSSTYTPTSGTNRIRVRMCGGGGGGGAATTNNGTNGGTSSFGSWTAIGGSFGLLASASVGAGGTGGANGSGTLIVRLTGGSGTASWTGVAGVSMPGGMGGINPFGGNGLVAGNFTGGSGINNTGAGGGGGGSTGASIGGSGGGAGEYVEFFVYNPSATSYTVGAGGTGGAAGGNAGGNGGSGVIIIEEYPY